MANHDYNLEEQLAQDRRLGKTRRRKRFLRRLIPLLLILALLGGLVWLLRPEEDDSPAAARTTEPGEAQATLCFVGDINLDLDMLRAFNGSGGYDFSPLFRRVTALLSEADLTLGNLEGNIITQGNFSDHNYPPELLRDLYAAGFDILQTANSYSIQNGISGLSRTREEILASGMAPLGTWSSEEQRREEGVLVREINGLRFAFLGFTKGMNNLRLPEGAEACVNLLYTDYDTNYTQIARSAIAAAVEEARAAEPDVIVAMVHWGSEYDQQIADSQKDIAKLLFDSGVHVIVGSHSHYVSAMELKNKSISPFGGSFIAYSLGDFVSLADNSASRSGCILTLRFQKDRSGLRISQAEYTPIFSAAPSEQLEVDRYEVLNTLDAISFYEGGYYDRVSQALYEKLVAAVERMKEQTGVPELQSAR